MNLVVDRILTVGTPITQEAIEAELREIHQHLGVRTRRMRFSSLLEASFREHLQHRAVETLTHGWWALLLFYLFVGVTTYAEVRLLSYPLFAAGNLQVWWSVYLVEGLVIAGFIFLPRLPDLHRRYGRYTGVCAALGISAIIIATSAFPDPYFNQHSSYVVIFIISTAYSIGILRLRPAAIACWGAVLFSGAIIHVFNLWMDWGFYLQYAVLANVVGMLLCYMLEHRDRIMFLQARLLELEKNKLDRLSRELDRLSREDVLTGLANRRHFNEMFQMEWDRARRENKLLSLLFVDIDHFKPFNDSHGHLEGDRVLSSVGTALKGVLRRPGDIAARYGGEEFVLLLPGTPLAGALEVAVQVQQAIEALQILHRASKVSDYLTASVGVAAVQPAPDMRSSQLIDLADEAVYAAKAAGRNCIMQAGPEGFSLAVS
jgi:diguanylate cyclase (GGDEF)-like protein